MFIELEPIFNNIGASVPFDYEMDKSDEEFWEAMTETSIVAGYEGKAGFQMDVATDTYHNKEDGK